MSPKQAITLRCLIEDYADNLADYRLHPDRYTKDLMEESKVTLSNYIRSLTKV